jgi:hypothetical protein
MASPCACGGLALLLSALKAEGQAVTPARVRRAVENTCLPVAAGEPDALLTYGRGLLQVRRSRGGGRGGGSVLVWRLGGPPHPAHCTRSSSWLLCALWPNTAGGCRVPLPAPLG